MGRVSEEERILAVGMGLKNPMSRRVFLQLSAAAGVAVPIGAAEFGFATPATAGVPGKAAANFASLAVNYWAAFAAGYKDAMSAFKIESIDLIHDNDAVRELSQVRGLPTQGVNMLVSTVVSAGETPMVAKLCQQNKIYYQCCWEMPDWFTPSDVGDFFVAYETPNSVQAAYESAKVLFKSIGGEGKVVHIKGLATPTDVSRSAGLMKAAAEFPGIEIVGGLRGDWQREKSRQVMLSMVTAYPDMKGVFAQNDDEAIGALSVLQERSDLSHVKVASVDGVPQAVEEVAKGGSFVATNLALPPYMAGFAATMLFDSFNGWKAGLPERLIYTGSPTATAENAGKIYQDIYKAEKLPFDWVKMSRTLSPDNWDPQNKIIPIDPKEHWKDAKGEEKLNAAYNAADWPEQLAKVTKMYADHYKSGPFYAA
jgi:ribose transport system substrate-binding protein